MGPIYAARTAKYWIGTGAAHEIEACEIGRKMFRPQFIKIDAHHDTSECSDSNPFAPNGSNQPNTWDPIENARYAYLQLQYEFERAINNLLFGARKAEKISPIHITNTWTPT